MIRMLNRQSHELLVLFFAVVTFAVVILFLAGITSFDCIGDCFPNAVTADGEMHYISDFFSQCKYATGAENAWPWFICAAIIALSVQCKLCLHQMCEVVQIDFEERRERRENNDENDKNDKNDKNDGQDKTTARTRTRSRSRITNPPSVRIRSRRYGFADDCKC